MAAVNVLSLIPRSWWAALAVSVLLAVGVAFGLGAWLGYGEGYEKAEAKGQTALAELQGEYDRAYAEAMQILQARVQAQAQHAMKVSNELATEKANNAKEQATLRAQLARVVRGSTHTFSPEFVRLWNRATGADCDALPAAGGSARADGTAGAGQAAGAGLLCSRSGRVTEADVLAYIIYYGERCRNLEAQVSAWIDLAEGWE